MNEMHPQFQDWAWQETLRMTECFHDYDELPDLDDVDATLLAQ